MKLQPKQLALVTGASGGLGECFARQLAGRGLDLVLVARSEEKLNALAAELRTAHKIDARVLPADLGDPAGVAAVAAEAFGPTARRRVDLLINNAGVGSNRFVFDQTDDQVREMVAVNVDALVRLTRSAVVSMVNRRQGAVLNIGSMGGFQACPRLAVYAATKAFVMSFGEATDYECRPHGVSVTTFCPGPTSTGFQSTAGASDRFYKRAEPADAVAAKAIAAVEAGRRLTCTTVREALLSQINRISPRRATVAIAARMLRDVR